MVSDLLFFKTFLNLISKRADHLVTATSISLAFSAAAAHKIPLSAR